MIKVLDVCSGIGGFSLGLEATGSFETVAFCEVDKFCCKVLNKHWPNVPIYDDLKELGNEPERIIQDFDLLCGGIPCQPFSQAGNRKGKEDDRHLWPYVFEIIKSKKPTWVIIENVAGFVNMALDDVCLDLETENYSTQPYVIPACGIEAPHRRDRVWIIGKLMVDPKCDKHIGEVGGSLEEKGENEKRHGEEYSSTRISSRTSEVRLSNNGHEGGEVMANSESIGENGVCRETKSEHDQGNARMESKCSSNGQSKQEPSQEVADSESDRLLSRNGGLRDGNGNGLLSNEERDGSEVRGEVSGRSRLRTKENVADSECEGLERQHELSSTKRGKNEGSLSGSESSFSRVREENATDSSSERLQRSEQHETLVGETETPRTIAQSFKNDGSQWAVEPNVGRVADGIPNRVDRLKSLGNAIVPQIIYQIGVAIAKEDASA
jgi:DNA (cytosine-5)-methyltransferase 1